MWELARLFLRLSVLAFGGPVAHIALAEDEIVNRRKWLTREHYLDLRTPDGLSVSPVAIVLAVGSLLALVRWKVNATWLIIIGAVVGLLLGR
jgi:chromate transport protein ChrA